MRHCLARGVGGQVLLSMMVRAGLDPVQHPALVQTLRGDAPPAAGGAAGGVRGQPPARGGPMGLPRAAARQAAVRASQRAAARQVRVEEQVAGELQRALHATEHARSELRVGVGDLEASEAAARYRALVEPARDARRGGGGGGAGVQGTSEAEGVRAAAAADRRAAQYDASQTEGRAGGALDGQLGREMRARREKEAREAQAGGRVEDGGRARAEEASLALARAEAKTAGLGPVGRHEAVLRETREELGRMQVEAVARQAAESGLPGSGGAGGRGPGAAGGKRGSAYDLGLSRERKRGTMVIVDGGRGQQVPGQDGEQEDGEAAETQSSRPGTRDAAPSYYALYQAELRQEATQREKDKARARARDRRHDGDEEEEEKAGSRSSKRPLVPRLAGLDLGPSAGSGGDGGLGSGIGGGGGGSQIAQELRSEGLDRPGGMAMRALLAQNAQLPAAMRANRLAASVQRAVDTGQDSARRARRLPTADATRPESAAQLAHDSLPPSAMAPRVARLPSRGTGLAQGGHSTRGHLPSRGL